MAEVESQELTCTYMSCLPPNRLQAHLSGSSSFSSVCSTVSKCTIVLQRLPCLRTQAHSSKMVPKSQASPLVFSQWPPAASRFDSRVITLASDQKVRDHVERHSYGRCSRHLFTTKIQIMPVSNSAGSSDPLRASSSMTERRACARRVMVIPYHWSWLFCVGFSCFLLMVFVLACLCLFLLFDRAMSFATFIALMNYYISTLWQVTRS